MKQAQVRRSGRLQEKQKHNPRVVLDPEIVRFWKNGQDPDYSLYMWLSTVKMSSSLNELRHGLRPWNLDDEQL